MAFLVVLMLAVLLNGGVDGKVEDSAELLALMVAQGKRTATTIPKDQYPTSTQSIITPGELDVWQTTEPAFWTAGFFPGYLWQMYNATNQTFFQEQALAWNAGLKGQEYDASTTDTSFKVFQSFGRGYQLGNLPPSTKQEYLKIILQGAKTVSTLYSPQVGSLRSWEPGYNCREEPTFFTNFTVTIDNMAQLDLLFFASENGGGSTYYDMAVKHAETTQKNMVRKDGSTFQVTIYNPETGDVEKKCTNLGYHDNSTWARGQAWCMYGFLTAYQYTNRQDFLQTSRECTNNFASHLYSCSKMPLWDFDWDGSDDLNHRDSSAGMIALSAVLQLSDILSKSPSEKDKADAARYKQLGEEMLNAVIVGEPSCEGARGFGARDYIGKYDETEGVLLHASGNFPAGVDVNTSIVYADFYLLESLRYNMFSQ